MKGNYFISAFLLIFFLIFLNISVLAQNSEAELFVTVKSALATISDENFLVILDCGKEGEYQYTLRIAEVGIYKIDISKNAVCKIRTTLSNVQLQKYSYIIGDDQGASNGYVSGSPASEFDGKTIWIEIIANSTSSTSSLTDSSTSTSSLSSSNNTNSSSSSVSSIDTTSTNSSNSSDTTSIVSTSSLSSSQSSSSSYVSGVLQVSSSSSKSTSTKSSSSKSSSATSSTLNTTTSKSSQKSTTKIVTVESSQSLIESDTEISSSDSSDSDKTLTDSTTSIVVEEMSDEEIKSLALNLSGDEKKNDESPILLIGALSLLLVAIAGAVYFIKKYNIFYEYIYSEKRVFE